MYYDINKTLSRQRLFNFVIGPRGCGKTYGAKRHVIRRFLRYGEQFVYLRRYDTELPAAEIKNFFDDVGVEFPDHEFNARNGLFKIDGEIAGWYFPLSKAIMLKSIPFPRVSLIIFDEFIIETGMHHYLPNETRAFLECYSTISRDRDIPALFLSNAVSSANPYFLYFDIRFENDSPGLYLTDFISAEFVVNTEYVEHVNNTKFGQLIANTKYGEYAVSNKFLLDNNNFISPMPAGCQYVCTFIFTDKEVGFYVNPEATMWYVSQRIDKTCQRRYVISINDHTENTALAINNIYIKSLVNRFCQGLLRFDSAQTKNICDGTIRKLI